jgi:hypothetical protein
LRLISPVSSSTANAAFFGFLSTFDSVFALGLLTATAFKLIEGPDAAWGDEAPGIDGPTAPSDGPTGPIIIGPAAAED